MFLLAWGASAASIRITVTGPGNPNLVFPDDSDNPVLTVTVMNTGKGILNIRDIGDPVIVSPNTSPIANAYVVDGTCSGNVPAGGSCYFGIFFDTLSVPFGVETGTLQVPISARYYSLTSTGATLPTYTPINTNANALVYFYDANLPTGLDGSDPPSAAPEPGSFVLIGCGLIGLAAIGRRRGPAGIANPVALIPFPQISAARDV